MANQKQYTDTLQNICNIGFTANHLINFQLVRSIPTNTVQQGVSSKPEYFCFVVLAPGEGGGENRNYNFQNKLTIKFSLQELCGLSFVLKTWANCMGKACLPYTKFARSGGGTKSVSIWEPAPVQGKARVISVTFKENNGNGLSVSIPPDQAFALAECLEELFKRGLNLDFDRQVNSPRVVQTGGNTHSYNNNNNNGFGSAPAFAPAPTTAPIINNPFDVSQIGNEFENMLLNR